MADSDSDDMPPPLEDMTEQIKINKQKKEEAFGKSYGGAGKSEDHTEEIRLAPKKKQGTENSSASSNQAPSKGLAPKDDDYDFDAKKKADTKVNASEAQKDTQSASKQAQ